MQPPGRRGGAEASDRSTELVRGSAPHERNQREGDRPIPFRTRKLSPSSPKVLRRQAVGG